MFGSPRSLFRVPKVSNRQRRRIADLAITQAQKVHVILLAILAQKGGEITVTQGTLDQVEKEFAELDYQIVPAGKGEYLIRLLEGGKADAEDQALPDSGTIEPTPGEQTTGEEVI